MLVCLPSTTSAAALYPPSAMMSSSIGHHYHQMSPLIAANASPPPAPPMAPQPALFSRQQHILRIEIRCTCHIDLLDAQFAISHNEQTNDFFVELLSSAQHRLLSAPVLSILFRFLPSQPEHLQIFPSSYGHWRSCGSVQPLWWMQQHCAADLKAEDVEEEEQPVRLHVHVHESHYAVELNGVEVERVDHKREFRQLPPPPPVFDDNDDVPTMANGGGEMMEWHAARGGAGAEDDEQERMSVEDQETVATAVSGREFGDDEKAAKEIEAKKEEEEEKDGTEKRRTFCICQSILGN